MDFEVIVNYENLFNFADFGMVKVIHLWEMASSHQFDSH
jgi:hypothetical protein